MVAKKPAPMDATIAMTMSQTIGARYLLMKPMMKPVYEGRRRHEQQHRR